MKKIFILLSLIAVISCTSSEISQKNVAKHPKNVILMIGDGMGIAQIQAAMAANGNALQLERATITGYSKTSSSDNFITDSAAGATAFSIGEKSYNGAIGVDKDKVAQTTILEYADRAGLSTGLVVTSSITHATPAAFIAHQPSRYMAEEIALDFLSTDIDVFIGGGKRYFKQRKDGLNLIDSLEARNYKMAYDLNEMGNVVKGKMAALLGDSGLSPFSKGRGEMLVPATQKALELLQQNDNGFFVMIEGSQIDWGAHRNDIEYVVSELLDFDNAIGKVLDFAENDGNTLVIITADHETGGLTLVGEDILNDSTATHFSTTHHTAVMVPVYAYGPGAEAFSGTYENNTIFDKMMLSLGLEASE